jgi:hypothetical protein
MPSNPDGDHGDEPKDTAAQVTVGFGVEHVGSPVGGFVGDDAYREPARDY